MIKIRTPPSHFARVCRSPNSLSALCWKEQRRAKFFFRWVPKIGIADRRNTVGRNESRYGFQLPDDISDCLTFDLSGVTSAAPKLENRSARSSETKSNSRSDAPTPESSISFDFPFYRTLLAFPSFVVVLSIPLIKLYGDKNEIKP